MSQNASDNSQTRAGLADAPNAPANEGATSHPIRGQATSPRTGDEQSKLRSPSPTIADRKGLARNSSPGSKEPAQAL